MIVQMPVVSAKRSRRRWRGRGRSPNAASPAGRCDAPQRKRRGRSQSTDARWRDDVNAKGGLLGRPVELVYYDDESNPNNVPGIYTKLISVNKVDLQIGPYATNMI